LLDGYSIDMAMAFTAAVGPMMGARNFHTQSRVTVRVIRTDKDMIATSDRHILDFDKFTKET
jgi:acetate kinase